MLSREEKVRMLTEKYRYEYVEFFDDWHADTLAYYTEEMGKESCIEAENFHFDLPGNQVAVIGTLDPAKLIRKNASEMIKKHNLNPFELRKALNCASPYTDLNIYVVLESGRRAVYQKVSCNVENYESPLHEPQDQNIIHFLEEHLEAWVDDHICDWKKQILSTLNEDWNYYTSDEFIIEHLQINGTINENLDFIDPEESIYPEEYYWEETTNPEPAPAEYAEAA